MNRFVKNCNLLAQLPPGCQHWAHDGYEVDLIVEQGLDAAIERKTTHRSGQKAESLEHAPDVVRQARGHANELGSGSKQRASTMGLK